MMQSGDMYEYDLQADINEIAKGKRLLMLLDVGDEVSKAVFVLALEEEQIKDSDKDIVEVDYDGEYCKAEVISGRPVRISNDDLGEYRGRFADNVENFNSILFKAGPVIAIDLDSSASIENDDGLSLDDRYSNVYPLGNIKVDKGFYTVFELKRKYDSLDKRIILDSDFQRENVWSIKQNSELVESVLMGLPLPIFYFNQDKYGRIIVVDGRQRLSALFKFLNGEYALKNLVVLSDLNGCKFSELSAIYQTKIEDYQISAHVIMPPTPERIKYDIFDRVNRGGTKLNKQEIRNALYQGRATRLLNEIVQTKAFANSTGGAFNRDKRMKNKYLITRFFAEYLYVLGRLKDDNNEQYVYNGDLDDMLGKSLDTVNSMNDSDALQLKSLTVGLLEKVFTVFGENAFRMPSDSEKKNPINMNLFEYIMMVMLNVDTISDKVSVFKRVMGVINSPEFIDNIGDHRDGTNKYRWRLDKAISTGKEIGQ